MVRADRGIANAFSGACADSRDDGRVPGAGTARSVRSRSGNGVRAAETTAGVGHRAIGRDQDADAEAAVVTMSMLVLGLGNLVHADDGVGVHAIERLQTDAHMPAGVTLTDGGTHGLGL